MTNRYLPLLLLIVTAAVPLSAQSQTEAFPLLGDSVQVAAIEAAARTLEAEISSGHPEVLTEWFDSNAFLDRANDDRQIGAVTMMTLRSEFRDGSVLLSDITTQLREGGRFKFLRIVERDGSLRARFRFLSPTSSLNYHDLLLVPDSSGSAGFVDTYVFYSAEDLSDTIGRLMEMMAAEGSLSPRVKAYDEFFTLFNAGHYRDAWNAFPAEHIDPSNRKALMLMRIQLGMNVGDREYHQALDDFIDAFPDDPSLALLLIDIHFNNGEYEAMLETVDRLEVSVGGDSYLSVLRAFAHLGLDAPATALEEARRARQGEPELLIPNLAEFRALVVLEHFDEAVASLQRMTDQGFELDLHNIESDPINEAFVLSEPYLMWREELYR